MVLYEAFCFPNETFLLFISICSFTNIHLILKLIYIYISLLKENKGSWVRAAKDYAAPQGERPESKSLLVQESKRARNILRKKSVKKKRIKKEISQQKEKLYEEVSGME